MSGHNKWSTIKHKKGKADAIRGRIFTKLIKEITVAARMGGGSEESNARLRTAVLAARAANMPSDNITRAIKKGTGELEGVSYEDVVYEGYGPDGIAILVCVLTDNKNRSVSEVRRVFMKQTAKLAEVGAVGYLFSDKGRIEISSEGVDEDKLTELVLESGADDFSNEGESYEILTAISAFEDVRKAVEAAGHKITGAGMIKHPATLNRVEGKPAQSLLRLIDALEDLDDVQNVYTNAEFDDSVMDDEE